MRSCHPFRFLWKFESKGHPLEPKKNRPRCCYSNWMTPFQARNSALNPLSELRSLHSLRSSCPSRECVMSQGKVVRIPAASLPISTSHNMELPYSPAQKAWLLPSGRFRVEGADRVRWQVLFPPEDEWTSHPWIFSQRFFLKNSIWSLTPFSKLSPR